MGRTNLWQKILTFWRNCLGFGGYSLDLTSAPVFQHAVATPLSVLQLNLSLLRSSQIPETQSQALQRAQAATTHLVQLFSYLSGNYQSKASFELGVVLKRAVALHATSDRKLIYHSIRATTQVWIKGDELLFLEALNCLINNAFASYRNQTEAKTVILSSIVHQHQAEINLVDFGQGMTELQIENILAIKSITSFQQHGIGLPFAKQTIERKLNGRLAIESFPGFGTKIDIYLPLVAATNLKP